MRSTARRTMRGARAAVATAAFVVLTAVDVWAEFNEGDLPGTYAFVIGINKCPKEIVLTGNELDVAADTITVDGNRGGGGALRLAKNSVAGGNALSEYLVRKSDLAGGILSGSLENNLRYGGSMFVRSTVFNFLRAEKDFTLSWGEVFSGAETAVASSSGATYDFQAEASYIVIQSTCVYREATESNQSNGGKMCFPASATAQLESGSTRRMDQLAIGDRVLTSPGVFSDVFAWTHHDPLHTSPGYVHISTLSSHDLTVTAGHFVYANGGAIPADAVRIGDTMMSANGTCTRVVSVQRVTSRGLFNPQTLDGNIVVDGLACSTYTAAVAPGAAHALLAPLRMAYSAVHLLLEASRCRAE